MSRSVFAFFFIIAIMGTTLSASGCSRSSEAGIIVAGSTSVQPFAEILAEEYMHLHSDITIDIQGGGSSAGIMAVQSGTAAIGMSSRALKDEEKTLYSLEIAKDGLALIVHPDNPVTDLTLDQIRAIYTRNITDWRQLGGTAPEIHVITREEGSGTRSAFESLVMGVSTITPKALVQDSNGAVRQLVADDPAAIGFISMGLVDISVKALAINGIAASHDNITNGSYGLSRPFLFVMLTEPAGEVKSFIDFIRSADGQRILAAEGLVTLEEDQAG